MPAISATAPGKIILFGEHSVVYGRPAIAAPVSQVQARVVALAEPRAPGGRVRLQAPDISLDSTLDDLPPQNPLAAAIRGTVQALGVARMPACTLRITSTIPVAAGLGSGAAVSVALIRAVSAFLGQPLPDEQVSALVFEVEKVHHGIPSGIDNTVITFNKPVYFVRDTPIESLRVPVPFMLVIADSGIASPTKIAVADVRHAWQAQPEAYEQLFDASGEIVKAARQAIEGGRPESLGGLMDENQVLLRKMGVSSPELERLVEAAHTTGALGAKLSGGGRGGNMIALVKPGSEQAIAQALQAAGATRTIITEIRN